MKSKRMPPLPPKQAEEQQDGTAQTAQAHALPKDQAKWCLIMGTLAGGLSSLVPLEEKVFRRLDLLQQAMVASALIPRNAGLHPLQCSQPRVPKRPSHSKTLRNATATIVDGRILHKFVDLEKITQIKLAMSIGSTVESILDTLLEISLVSVW
ncbi:hypothetical protein BASA81_015620 [Batrachochytrium salamandrivorans]|nr:hypothetical protein BASA81_015620 [Batrachochytrium salamandrivorans]